MEILKNNSELIGIIEKNQCIIVKYHTDQDCPECKIILPVYEKLAKDENYKEIVFVRMNSDNNMIAQKLINKRKLPFAVTYKNGLLIEGNTITKEEDLRNMLNRLAKMNINI